VAVNEAVELGKRFGAENSGAFINGILDSFLKTMAPTVVTPPVDFNNREKGKSEEG
jgi:hypothetical protein